MLIEYGRKLGETLWCLIGYNWDQFLIAEFNFRTSELRLAFFSCHHFTKKLSYSKLIFNRHAILIIN
jgi:hypothetical protein